MVGHKRRFSLFILGGGGYSYILAIRVCDAGEGMVFKPFGLVKGMVFNPFGLVCLVIIENWCSIAI